VQCKVAHALAERGGIVSNPVIVHEQPVLYSADLGNCEALDAFDEDGISRS